MIWAVLAIVVIALLGSLWTSAEVRRSLRLGERAEPFTFHTRNFREWRRRIAQAEGEAIERWMGERREEGGRS